MLTLFFWPIVFQLCLELINVGAHDVIHIVAIISASCSHLNVYHRDSIDSCHNMPTN